MPPKSGGFTEDRLRGFGAAAVRAARRKLSADAAAAFENIEVTCEYRRFVNAAVIFYFCTGACYNLRVIT